jgi:hypothetical protein
MKISIQAPEPRSGCVRDVNGVMVRSRTCINKCNGASTLFASSDISPGTATTMTCRRKRRFEFQDFPDSLRKRIPDMCGPDSGIEVHFTLDNCITG